MKFTRKILFFSYIREKYFVTDAWHDFTNILRNKLYIILHYKIIKYFRIARGFAISKNKNQIINSLIQQPGQGAVAHKPQESSNPLFEPVQHPESTSSTTLTVVYNLTNLPQVFLFLFSFFLNFFGCRIKTI